MITRRHAVFTLSGVSHLCGQAWAPEPVRGQVITVPGRLGSVHQILIAIRINNSEPIWSVLDSGSPGIVRVGRETAEAIGLRPSWEGHSSGPGQSGRQKDGRTRAIVTVAGLNLGAPVVVIAPQGMPGFIGMPLFSSYVIDLDYSAASVRLHRAADFRYTGTGDTIPFSLNPTFDYVPETETVLTVGSTKIRARLSIDTGCGGCSAWLSRSFQESHEPLTAMSISGYHKIAKLSVGPVSVVNPTVWLAPKRGFGGGTEPDGLLGLEFLRKFRIFMDYSRSQLILESNAPIWV